MKREELRNIDEEGYISGERSASVWYRGRRVGRLANLKGERFKTAFEYDSGWLETGFSISPFSLPLKPGVFIPQKLNFDGMFGIFSDSLPDGWGRLLIDRVLGTRGINPSEANALDKLSLIGSSGMGALEYRPERFFLSDAEDPDYSLDDIAEQCRITLKAVKLPEGANVDMLFKRGGSSGGARPKITTEDGWIIKFPASFDDEDSGALEYDYSILARECGIAMPETKLFPSERCSGYFASKRFDRSGEEGADKLHMASAAALLECDFREPALDYADLLKLTKILTRDREEDVWQMFRLACFNVFAGNQDDHAKNFSFLYIPKERPERLSARGRKAWPEEPGAWRLAPAYDLTRSSTYFGEQTTSVLGKGRDITVEDFAELGAHSGLPKKKCRAIAEEIREIVLSPGRGGGK